MDRREVDQRLSAAGPAGKVGLLDPELVEGEKKALPLGLSRVAGIADLPRGPQLVVDGLDTDHPMVIAEEFLVGYPRQPAGQAAWHQDEWVAFPGDVISQDTGLHATPPVIEDAVVTPPMNSIRAAT